MKPLPDETAGSLALRLAEIGCQSLAGFCQHTLGLSYWQAQSDLDRILPSHCAPSLARAAEITSGTVRSLSLPTAWTISTWRKGWPCHTGPARFCPACLSESRHGRRFWRSRFAAACPDHGLELIESCPRCGKSIPYFGTPGGITTQFWLETWPLCPTCLGRIGLSGPAHPLLVAMSGRWRAALAGRPQLGFTANEFLKFSARLLTRFNSIWRYQVAAALAAPPSHWTAHLASAFLIQNLVSPKTPVSVFHAALGIPFDPAQLANDIVS